MEGNYYDAKGLNNLYNKDHEGKEQDQPADQLLVHNLIRQIQRTSREKDPLVNQAIQLCSVR